MTHSITTVTPNNVPSLTYGGKPVVTTAVLAELYGTDAKRIQNNYARNKGRFEHGKHFYKIEGKELSSLRPSLRGSQIPAKARTAILWTERGAARHAKMLETNAAWDVFEALEDNYFGPHQAKAPQAALPNPLSPRHQRELQKAIAGRIYSEVPAEHRSSAFKRVYSHLKDRFEVGSYKDIDDSQYTEALGAIQSFALEGEWLEARPGSVAVTLDESRLRHLFCLYVHFKHVYDIYDKYSMYEAMSLLGSRAGVEMHDHLRDGVIMADSIANHLKPQFDLLWALQPNLRRM